jgi:hypothetical protein
MSKRIHKEKENSTPEKGIRKNEKEEEEGSHRFSFFRSYSVCLRPNEHAQYTCTDITQKINMFPG